MNDKTVIPSGYLKAGDSFVPVKHVNFLTQDRNSQGVVYTTAREVAYKGHLESEAMGSFYAIQHPEGVTALNLERIKKATILSEKINDKSLIEFVFKSPSRLHNGESIGSLTIGGFSPAECDHMLEQFEKIVKAIKK